MTAPRASTSYLADMLAAMEKVESFIQGFDEEQFRRDEKTIFAVIRALEIVGEAAKRVPDTIRQTYGAVPWRAMTGMRDKLIHDYTVVDLTVVRRTASEDLPTLKPLLQQIYIDLQPVADARGHPGGVFRVPARQPLGAGVGDRPIPGEQRQAQRHHQRPKPRRRRAIHRAAGGPRDHGEHRDGAARGGATGAGGG